MVKVLSLDVENALISVQIVQHEQIQHINTVGTVKATWLEEVSAESSESVTDREQGVTPLEHPENKMMSDPGENSPIATVPTSTFMASSFDEDDAIVDSETSSVVPRSDSLGSADELGQPLADELRERVDDGMQEQPGADIPEESPSKHEIPFVVPQGELPFSSVVDIVEGVKSRELNARDLLASMVRDGAPRSIQGEILRAVLQHDLPLNGVAAQVLGKIRSVELKDNVLAVHFNTKGRYTITLPATKKWVLHSKNRENPFLVHRLNRPVESAREARKFSLAPTVRLNVTDEGITSICKGDVMVKSLIKLNVDMNTCRAEGKMATDRSGRPYLIIDNKTRKPLVVRGKYQPQVFDEWLRVAVFGYKTWVGLKAPRS